MRLHLEKSYDIAVQLAQRAQSTKLAQRIHILKRAKFGELAIDSEEEEDEEGRACVECMMSTHPRCNHRFVCTT